MQLTLQINKSAQSKATHAQAQSNDIVRRAIHQRRALDVVTSNVILKQAICTCNYKQSRNSSCIVYVAAARHCTSGWYVGTVIILPVTASNPKKAKKYKERILIFLRSVW